MKINNSNDARNSLLDTIANLKSGKATNLDEVALQIKGFAVLNGLQDRHHDECRINGKTSAKQNSGWARYAKEQSTAEKEAKAKAKAEKAKPVDNVNPQKLDELQSDLRDITAKLEELQDYDKRRSVTRDEIAKQTARLIAVKAQIKELS